MTSTADAIAARQKPAPGELALDHISHFLPDLDAAAAWLSRLGFAVTPLSVQQTQDGPAGSSNRCVMLEEGYLEFLTPTMDTPVARQMRTYMAKHIGTHLACFGTPEAALPVAPEIRRGPSAQVRVGGETVRQARAVVLAK